MIRYRQSIHDPNAYARQGPPLRPFNWVQWLGVAFAGAGVGIALAYLGGRAGWTPKLLDSPVIGSALVLLAIVLINSRRQTITDPAPGLAPARGRWMIIFVSFCVVLIGAATILQLIGA